MDAPEKIPTLIFGGGFNPPTVAHQAVIEACLDLPDFQEVWVMPSGDRHDKQMKARDADRLAMLALVKEHEFDNDPRLRISDFELKLPRPSETQKTVGELALAHAAIDFWFTFGHDAYLSMPSWDGGLELQSSLNMVVVERGDLALPERPGIVPMRVASCAGISSTVARERVAAGESLESFVCRSVGRYISTNRLYSELTDHAGTGADALV